MENLSKEKQIDEIAEIIRKANGQINSDYYRLDAEAIYNADYRKQEWISVEDMLPEKYGYVLCYTRHGTIWQVIYNPQYKLFNVSSDNTEDALAVDYWMPLPEAPKMRKEDEGK